VCLNSLVHSAFFLLKRIKRVKRRQEKNKSARRLYRRKRLPANVKRHRQRKKSALYNVNCVRKPIRRLKQQKKLKKR
jgi:hypothetical protein